MERLCPDALLVNYTNPVPRICTAIKNYSKLRFAGVCHQVEFGYYLAGVLLSDVIGLPLPEDYYFRWTEENIRAHNEISRAAKKKLAIHAVGLNHFTWALSVISREDGRELYPVLRERNREFDREFEPLTRKVFDLFGLLPTPGDTHLCEYLPFTHSTARGTWEKCDMQMYDFDRSKRVRAERTAMAHRIIEGKELSLLDHVISERAELLIEALVSRNMYVDEALNVTNDGAIPNLPADAVVEAPTAFLPSGPRPLTGPPLPEAIAELCRRQVVINELSVAGMVEGDRDKLLTALALDPMVDDPDLPVQLLDEYLREFETYLGFFYTGP